MLKYSPISRVSFVGFLIILFFGGGCKILHDPDARPAVQQPVIKRTDQGESVVVKAGQIYEAGKVKRFFLGDHYRDLWTAPVEVPVLDIDQVMNGLEILEAGGGMQTYSLKLKAENGQLYSLRSVQKDPTPVLPKALQYSFADDIVQDQISASHPFGPYILPMLGDAAGIYHTNPKLYYLPDSPKLGKYREEYGGALVMLEEDADEDWSENEDFGYTENAVSSETMREEMLEDNDHSVDQESFLRVRLFDMWINDWDRHEGQFRWAEFEDGDQTIYRPIPEDRDNIFFRFDGLIPWVVSRKWAMRKFQDFRPEVRDIIGLNHNARYSDRRFLTELVEEDWIAMAKDLESRLTDEIITEAVKLMPDTIYALNGEELTRILIARRDHIEDMARSYYKVLAEEVNVVGSNDSEFFDVNRQPNGNVLVEVYESNDDGNKDRKFYSREFVKDETKEIRLYGRGDRDHFELTGSSDRSILVRIIGGEGADYVNDTSSVRGLASKTRFYDTMDGNNITETTEDNGETKLYLSDNQHIMRYDMEAFKYDKFMPQVVFGFNSDDKFFIGGGVALITHGFNRRPHATYQRFVANVSPYRKAWAFEYEGDFTNIIRSLGVNAEVVLRAPNYFSNFFGYGNDTKITEDDSFYEVNYNEFGAFVGLTVRTEKSLIKFGPEFQQFNARRNSESFIASYDPLPEDAFKTNDYLGFRVDADLRTIESDVFPERGIRWLTSLSYIAQTNNNKSKLSTFKSELMGFYTMETFLDITVAGRVGGATNSGDFNFYMANTISGNRGFNSQGNVRGLACDRFSGRSTLYQNLEIRIPFLRLPFYYLPFEVGGYGFIDNGRVWTELDVDEGSWHTSYGGGLYFRPLGMIVATMGVAKSEEDTLFNINLGFLF